MQVFMRAFELSEWSLRTSRKTSTQHGHILEYFVVLPACISECLAPRKFTFPQEDIPSKEAESEARS